MKTIRVALCQINTVVGDIAGNAEKIRQAFAAAETEGCHLAVFPELAISGYPPEDLLMKRQFIADCQDALNQLAAATQHCYMIVGFPSQSERPETLPRLESRLYNSAAVCGEGKVISIADKTHLPNYAVFDEHRYFSEGSPAEPVLIHGVKVGVSICEDLWIDGGAISEIVWMGAEMVININASPYHIGKWGRRQHLLDKRWKEFEIPFVYVNQVGGQDELVFDGQSVVYNNHGQIIARCPQFREEIQIVEVEMEGDYIFGAEHNASPAESATPPEAGSAALESELRQQTPSPQQHYSVAPPGVAPPSVAPPSVAPARVAPLAEAMEEIYEALKLGTSDYITKNGFSDVCVGLSGGIDSSLVATIAADALGPQRVHGVLLPSRYSSAHSISDAEALCSNLQIDRYELSIEPAHQAFLDMLKESLEEEDLGLTEENLQSRIRGIVLMAFANYSGWLNLTTGNKSESAVGYSTLYGDTAGAFAVIKDVWKQQVYALAEWRNELAETRGETPPVPPDVLTKAPSAELRLDQKDEDSLPPYDVLDPILFALVEQDLTAKELNAAGYDASLVTRISKLVDIAEYKRRQNPPGIRITSKAFGKDRRMPITHKYLGL